jgi:hypothetical protein
MAVTPMATIGTIRALMMCMVFSQSLLLFGACFGIYQSRLNRRQSRQRWHPTLGSS